MDGHGHGHGHGHAHGPAALSEEATSGSARQGLGQDVLDALAVPSNVWPGQASPSSNSPAQTSRSILEPVVDRPVSLETSIPGFLELEFTAAAPLFSSPGKPLDSATSPPFSGSPVGDMPLDLAAGSPGAGKPLDLAAASPLFGSPVFGKPEVSSFTELPPTWSNIGAPIVGSPGSPILAAPIVLPGQERKVLVLPPATISGSNAVVEGRVRVEQAPGGIAPVQAQARLQQQQAQMAQELQQTLQDERTKALPEVKALCQEHHARMLQYLEARIAQERSTVLTEVNSIILQQRAQTLELAMTRIQQEREPMIKQFQAMLQEERSNALASTREYVGQQVATVVEQTNQEFGKMVTMVNAVSQACDEHLDRLQKDIKLVQDSTMIRIEENGESISRFTACEDRLGRLEMDRAASATVVQDLRRDLNGIDSRVNVLTVSQEEIAIKFAGQAADSREKYLSSRHDRVKLEEVVADLQKEQGKLSEALGRQMEERLAEKHTYAARMERTFVDVQNQVNHSLQTAVAQLEKSRVAEQQQLLDLITGDNRATSGKHTLVEERLATLEKASSEVSEWMARMTKGPKNNDRSQTLDRYRQLLARREFKEWDE